MEKVDSKVYRGSLRYDLKCFCRIQERLSDTSLISGLDGLDFDIFLTAKSSFSERLQSDIFMLGGMAGEW